MKTGAPITTSNLESNITPIVRRIVQENNKEIKQMIADAVTQILTVMEKRFDRIDLRFERVDRRAVATEDHIDDHEVRLRTLESDSTQSAPRRPSGFLGPFTVK